MARGCEGNTRKRALENVLRKSMAFSPALTILVGNAQNVEKDSHESIP
jgi:hypothetical protein